MKPWLILLALTVAAPWTHATVVAEAKVYPAPGETAITNVEIYDPAALALYNALGVPAVEIVDGPLRFQQKSSANITCSQKYVDGIVKSTFCVMHMPADGALLPGVVASFDADVNAPTLIGGIGEVKVDGAKIEISAFAAKAMFTNMLKTPAKPTTDNLKTVKVGTALTCTRGNPSKDDKSDDDSALFSCGATLTSIKTPGLAATP